MAEVLKRIGMQAVDDFAQEYSDVSDALLAKEEEEEEEQEQQEELMQEEDEENAGKGGMRRMRKMRWTTGWLVKKGQSRIWAKSDGFVIAL